MAEREGLLGLRPRPAGRRRYATPFCATCGGLSNHHFETEGSNLITRHNKRKKAPQGDLFTFGGEGGIRTFGVYLFFNSLQRHRV